MKLEDQVVSLELAKRLKELGVKQESYAYWIEGEATYSTGRTENIIILSLEFQLGIDTQYSAFTVAELGAMLPFTIKMNEWKSISFVRPKTFYLDNMIGYTDHGYSPSISYNFYLYDDEEEHNEVELIVGPDFSDPNEANSRAQMLIYLLENGLININK
jgi:hypothetical protein